MLRIAWISSDGEEHEEEWPSIDRFLAWAVSDGAMLRWIAYADDGDGEWVEVGRGGSR